MGMDRNTVIGFVLIGVLLIGMFYINSRSNQAYLAEKKRVEDSIAATKPKQDLVATRVDSLKKDSLIKASQKIPSAFITDSAKEEHLDTLENNVMKVVFTNKGAQPKLIELKHYKKFDGKPIVLGDGNFSKISYTINSATNQTAETADILFVTGKKTTSADKAESISFASAFALSYAT